MTPRPDPAVEPPAPPKPRRRLADVDRAKGLMMIFVVLGHVYDPNGPQWANDVRALIYSFHMPFFMYLSGFIFVYTSSHILKPDFARYALNRANRLLVPFFVVALIIINMKILGEHVMTINKPVSSVFDAYGSILINTNRSAAVAIWYLFVLFVFSLVTPLAYTLLRERFLPLFLLGLAMQAWFVWSVYHGGLTDDFYFSRMCWFFVFFISGCIACKFEAVWLGFIRRAWMPCLAAFVVLDVVTLSTEWRYLIVGLVSMPAIHGLMGSRLMQTDRLLAFLGDYAMTIYLFNTLFIGLARGLFSKVAVPSQNMILLMIVSVPIGLIGPILLREALRRFPPTRPVARYLA